jgi:hypothetical protein
LWGPTSGQGGPVQPWMLVTPVWAAMKTLHTNGWPRTSGNVQAPPASLTPSKSLSAQAAPYNIGGLKPPGGDAGKIVGEWLVGGEDLVKKATEIKMQVSAHQRLLQGFSRNTVSASTTSTAC